MNLAALVYNKEQDNRHSHGKDLRDFPMGVVCSFTVCQIDCAESYQAIADSGRNILFLLYFQFFGVSRKRILWFYKTAGQPEKDAEPAEKNRSCRECANMTDAARAYGYGWRAEKDVAESWSADP